MSHEHRDASEAEEISVNPMFARSGETRIPRWRIPEGEMLPDSAYQIIHDEILLDGNARQNLATFVTTWMEPQAVEAVRRSVRQEHDRPGRVPADGRDRGAVRPHPGRPVELARAAHHDRHVDDRLLRGLHARRAGVQAPLGEAAPGRGQGRRLAEHRRQRVGPGRVGEVRRLLGRRASVRPGLEGAPEPLARGHARSGRRPHDLRGRDPRRHLHGGLRAREGARARARRPPDADAGSTCPCTSTVPPVASSHRSCDPELEWDFRL